MVSPDIQGLGLNDELLRHYKEEVTEMALGILDGKPFNSPIHEGILLTCMLEFLPYDDSDNSEFSQERFHSYMSELNDEIIEERRRQITSPLQVHLLRVDSRPTLLGWYSPWKARGRFSRNNSGSEQSSGEAYGRDYETQRQ